MEKISKAIAEIELYIRDTNWYTKHDRKRAENYVFQHLEHLRNKIIDLLKESLEFAILDLKNPQNDALKGIVVRKVFVILRKYNILTDEDQKHFFNLSRSFAEGVKMYGR